MCNKIYINYYMTYRMLKMKASKHCIQLILVILLILGASGCAQQANLSPQEELADNAGSQPESHPESQSELSAQKNLVVLQVSEVAGLIEAKGEAVFPELREEGGKWFQGDSYIFVWATNGTRLVYPPNPEGGEGQNVSGLTDINGKPIGKLFIEAALSESKEGWVSYEWTKPGKTEPSAKYGFIKGATFEGKTYLVGSGFYVEDYLFTNDIRDCEFINSTGVSLCELISPERTDKELGINYSIAYAVMEPGEKGLPHRLSIPEVHYVLEGRGTIYIDNVPVPLREGKLVHVPAHEVQYIENTGNSTLCFLAIEQPAWSVEYEETLE